MSLAGGNALVTGVSRRAGIGFAIARRLGEAGASVFVHGWTPHDVGQPWGAQPWGAQPWGAQPWGAQPWGAQPWGAQPWGAQPSGASPIGAQPWGGQPRGTAAIADELGVPFVEADFADADAPAAVVGAAVDAVGPLDVLVVNHARSAHGRLADLTAQEIDAFLHENVRASLLLVRAFAAQHDDDRGGRVVLMTSGQHLAPMAREVAYAVSKGALQQATLTLAGELADRGITVNTVNPGPTDTGWGLAAEDPAAAMPFDRWGEPDDAARLVAWLCSDDARWITGQTIDSEGGFRRHRWA